MDTDCYDVIRMRNLTDVIALMPSLHSKILDRLTTLTLSAGE